MHTSTIILALTSLLALRASAQQTYAINPDTVSDATREYWCQQQELQCPL